MGRMVPVVMTASCVLYAVNATFCRVIVGLSIVMTSTYLFRRTPSREKRESIVWIHYSLFLFLFLSSIDTPCNRDNNWIFVLLLCFIVGIILNHPIVEVIGR